MPFYVNKAHKEWYHEGAEDFDKNRANGEELWRLDFRLPDGNEFQAQLFCVLACKEATYDKYLEEGKAIPFKRARLFIERDNRHPDGSGDRVDYAFNGWKITPTRALEILAAHREKAVVLMAKEVAEVAAMPCDHAWLDRYRPSPQRSN